MRRSIPTTQRSFATAQSSTADAQTLAVIASSLVAATAIAFLAMVMTAWPVRAAEPVRLASVSPAMIHGTLHADDARTLLQPRITAPQAAAPAAAATQTAALGTLPMAAEPCPASVDAIDAEVNQSLTKVEAAYEADGAAQCQAFRVHMTSLQRAARAVDRCVQGEARASKLSLIRRSMTDWNGVIANGCH
ncbi:hypothetical protein [Phreatobacter sp.]|uniref:hypothetical protein n=1 Tax=Phreatobacter sp. TaxID=1966341 RepID=UPI003F7117C2